MRKYFPLAILVVVAVAFVTVTVAAVLYALPRRAFALTGVRRITVVGNHLLNAQEVLDLAGFPSQPQRQKLQPVKLSSRLCEHRFVRGAWVRRSGDTVICRISELQPYFRLVVGNDKYWLCRDGEYIPMDVNHDFGPLFDELRRHVSVRLAGMQLAEDPQTVALIINTAMRLEAALPRRFAEMRVDLRQRFQLVTKQGLVVELGEPSDLAEKVAVLAEALRAAGNLGVPVREIEYLDSTHVVLKKIVS